MLPPVLVFVRNVKIASRVRRDAGDRDQGGQRAADLPRRSDIAGSLLAEDGDGHQAWSALVHDVDLAGAVGCDCIGDDQAGGSAAGLRSAKDVAVGRHVAGGRCAEGLNSAGVESKVNPGW